jgi:hypothetical protein
MCDLVRRLWTYFYENDGFRAGRGRQAKGAAEGAEKVVFGVERLPQWLNLSYFKLEARRSMYSA